MTDSRDYRKFLESEFEHIRKELSFIKDQTTKTNDRVNHIEDEIVDLKLADMNHVIECPAMPKIESINQDLQEYRFFKKYPKIAIMIIVACILCGAYFFISTTSDIRSLTRQVDMINTPVRTRGGTVEWWPSGVVIDSVNESSNKP